MARKKTFQTFREAKKLGSYDERPMLPDEIDLQLHLSRNDRAQPFYLICGKDTLIAQLSGEGRVEFRGSSVNYHPLAPGDFIYVPAGAPHRIVPDTECVNFRYKATDAGLEGVAWYCESCGTEVHRTVWDTAKTISQEAYWDACAAFNGDESLRTCPGCGEVHQDIDVEPYRWTELAEEIRSEQAST